MKRIGVIGCGRIGGPVIEAIQAGNAGENTVVAVLAKHQHDLGGLVTLVDRDAFFKHSFDLIIDAATPDGLPDFGKQALQTADVWTVNAAALADAELYQSLESTARQYKNRLRVLSGAIAGLDGVAALAVDSDARVSAEISVAPSEEGQNILFQGTAREAAKHYPESVNAAVTASLAGAGLDKTEIKVVQPGANEERKLSLSAQSKYGQLNVTTVPVVRPDKRIHSVAASIIAALKREDKFIWVG